MKTNENHFNKIIPNGEPFPTDCYVNVLHLLNAAWRLLIHELVQTSDEFFHEKQTLAAENHGKFFTNKGEEILMEFSGRILIKCRVFGALEIRKGKKSDPNKNICWQAATSSSQHVLSLSDPRATQRPKWAYSIEHLSYPANTNRVRSLSHVGGWKNNPWRWKSSNSLKLLMLNNKRDEIKQQKREC